MARYRQWRKYTVRTGQLDDFIQEWRRGLVPIRQQYGFEVVQAWALQDESALLWLVAYEGENFEEAFERFRSSPERAALEPDPARHIESVDAWMASVVFVNGSVTQE